MTLHLFWQPAKIIVLLSSLNTISSIASTSASTAIRVPINANIRNSSINFSKKSLKENKKNSLWLNSKLIFKNNQATLSKAYHCSTMPSKVLLSWSTSTRCCFSRMTPKIWLILFFPFMLSTTASKQSIKNHLIINVKNLSGSSPFSKVEKLTF